jgi:hypothetical protein
VPAGKEPHAKAECDQAENDGKTEVHADVDARNTPDTKSKGSGFTL